MSSDQMSVAARVAEIVAERNQLRALLERILDEDQMGYVTAGTHGDGTYALTIDGGLTLTEAEHALVDQLRHVAGER